jgi:Ca2+/Na+ antiporter
MACNWTNHLVSTPHNSRRSALCKSNCQHRRAVKRTCDAACARYPPIATELPEKLNSVLWVSQDKDTFALGNITGAMVFQSCIPVASGIAFTAWTLGPVELFSAALALTGGLWVYVLAAKEKLTAPALIFNGVLYLLFIAVVLRG